MIQVSNVVAIETVSEFSRTKESSSEALSCPMAPVHYGLFW